MVIAPAGHFVAVREGVTLLEAALQAGLSLPRSCRNGTCRACMCRLVDGRIAYRVEWPGLTAEEKSEGWILPCVALAQSDVTIEQPDARVAPPDSRSVRRRAF
ncbi:2Fe-2S iron-sulfur cluster-binding protein [Caballeronia sp. INDeC2]|uniref:2Fe-2S iron-sulfur cluster-binding protein n=1 Tax=Caballeronia sp. INDeC2 TaxID=2921747 RepID=UPI002027E394|nr:2Fe-2S iron-sulfur cluster-binding protein [Caballeronia sp. INDeC2]